MRMFKNPDVDLLEQIYEGATVRLAPNDEESATITFNTGVAQLEAGKVASALTCKRCTSSNRKLADRAREFIGSTLTLKTLSTPCLKQRYGR